MTYYKTSRAGRNTFDYKMIRKLVESGEITLLEEIEIPVRTANDVIEEFFSEKHIDYISIDAEGLGAFILESLNLTSMLIDVILVEMNPNDPKSRELYIKLDKLGYEMEYTNIGMGQDFLFYKKQVFKA
jgi:hypothetical protein